MANKLTTQQKEELKQTLYMDYATGFTKEEVLEKYKEVPYINGIVTGTWNYYISNKEKFRAKQNPYRTELDSQIKDLEQSIGKFAEFLDKHPLETEIKAIGFVEQKILHDMESATEVELIDLAKKLGDLRKRRRALKDRLLVNAQLVNALKTATTPKAIKGLKETLNGLSESRENNNDKRIKVNYTERLENIPTDLRKSFRRLKREYKL